MSCDDTRNCPMCGEKLGVSIYEDYQYKLNKNGTIEFFFISIIGSCRKCKYTCKYKEQKIPSGDKRKHKVYDV